MHWLFGIVITINFNEIFMKNTIKFIFIFLLLLNSCKKDQKESLLTLKTWRYKTLVEIKPASSSGYTYTEICLDDKVKFYITGDYYRTRCYQEVAQMDWEWIDFEKEIELKETIDGEDVIYRKTILEMNDTLLILKRQVDTAHYSIYKYSGKQLSNEEWADFTGSSIIPGDIFVGGK